MATNYIKKNFFCQLKLNTRVILYQLTGIEKNNL